MYLNLRECAAEQLPSSWLQARVAKGLPTAPALQFRRQVRQRSPKVTEFQNRAIASHLLPEFRALGGQVWLTDGCFLLARNPKIRVWVAKMRFFFACKVWSTFNTFGKKEDPIR